MTAAMMAETQVDAMVGPLVAMMIRDASVLAKADSWGTSMAGVRAGSMGDGMGMMKAAGRAVSSVGAMAD